MTAVKMIAHDIAIMYLGRIVEAGPAAEVFDQQLNPYGRALLSSVLYPDPPQRQGRSGSRARSRARSACRRGARSPALPARAAACTGPCRRSRRSLPARASAGFRTGIVAAGGPDALLARDDRRARRRA